ncbi:MAG: NAD-binding protein, partial [Gammaproteobacteria bacterium]|nr:NAD-binding protein [Gammaproteobacteria bacterium]
MKIIILGGGAVGSSVASLLADEGHNDITIVDSRSEVLTELQERFDLRTVLGSASHPEVLLRAGADDADMILAVTNSDEVNMVACQIAYTLFHTPTKIARVRASEYLVHEKLFS